MAVGRAIMAVMTAAATTACGVVLGIEDVPNVEVADAGFDTSMRADATRHVDANSRDVTRMMDAARDVAREAGGEGEAAVACVAVVTPEAGLPEAACPGPTDASDAGSCVPTALGSSALAWVPPVPHRKLCTTAQITALFSPGTIEQSCFDCLVSYVGTGLTAYGATVNFPEFTTEVYGFPNFAGCIATLEPCNLACAKLVQAADLCVNEACMPGCPHSAASLDEFQACVSQAGDCPCAALLQAAETCTAEIIANASPAVVCFGNGGTGAAAYQTQVEAIGAVLCGGRDAGPDAD